MIVVDSSAVVAMVLGEPEREAIVRAIQQAEKALISKLSVLEARMVIHGRRGQCAVVLVDDLLRLPVFEMVPPGAAETDAAYAAFVAFGKGSGHPAGLNFGDVFSYALAKVRGLPLLFKGQDFAQTDVVSVLSAGTA
jgi:ribonuclease VapC